MSKECQGEYPGLEHLAIHHGSLRCSKWNSRCGAQLESMMKPHVPAVVFIAFVGLGLTAHGAGGQKVTVPANIVHEAYGAQLAKYVDGRGLVRYADWKANAVDLKALDGYLAQFAAKPSLPAEGKEAAASLINLYNALTIRTILSNYPTKSIMALSNPFGARRHLVGGTKVSLDDIEHGTLRPLIGERAHAVLVCAARSCPPLQRSVYRAETLEAQIAMAFEVWLGREDLNRFQPELDRVEISSIFKWFAEDFEKVGGVRKVLARRAPGKYRKFLSGDDYAIDYLTYNWGLNDQGTQGKNYGRGRLYFDRILDTITFWK